MRVLVAAACALLLTACASTTTQSGFLTSYEGLTKREDTVRAAVAQRQDATALQAIRRIGVEPTVFAPGADVTWMSEGERALLLRESDAQLCFELSVRYELARDGGDAWVRKAPSSSMIWPIGAASTIRSASAACDRSSPRSSARTSRCISKARRAGST